MSTLAPARPRLADAERLRLARRVRLLSWVSLGYMAIEGGVAILAGVLAGSVALVGFGLDSAIEGFASAIIVWRFTGHRVFSEAAETRAQKLVAIQFFVLAPYVGFESIRALVGGEHPGVSWLGIGLAASSLVVMPYLGIAKERLADRLGSAATKGEGRQNMLCAYLAGALLLGLLGNAIFGAWWLDPVVGLLIAGVAIKEGREAWRGEGCCVGDPLGSAADGDDGCQDDCCAGVEPDVTRTHLPLRPRPRAVVETNPIPSGSSARPRGEEVSAPARTSEPCRVRQRPSRGSVTASSRDAKASRGAAEHFWRCSSPFWPRHSSTSSARDRPPLPPRDRPRL